MIRPARNTELENSMDLFSGGRAISENLQLNRELRLSTDEQNRTIPVSSVTGITIDEIPWKEWMKDENQNSIQLPQYYPTTNMRSFSHLIQACSKSWTKRLQEGLLYSA